MIKVFQIQLSDAEVDAVNENGWNHSERTQAYFDKGFKSQVKFVDFKHYEHVANVSETEDLEEAFTLMNMWSRPERIEKLQERVSSMSVGDIVEKDGIRYLVASFGFEEIKKD